MEQLFPYKLKERVSERDCFWILGDIVIMTTIMCWWPKQIHSNPLKRDLSYRQEYQRWLGTFI